MKAVKKQYVLIQVGKELKWAQVKAKHTGTYYLEIVMDYTDTRMGWQCQENEILAVSDINVTVREFDVKHGLKG